MMITKGETLMSLNENDLLRGIEIFWRLFVVRDDVYAIQSKQDDRFIFKPVRSFITNKVLRLHLLGEITVGIYPGFNESKWVCIDIDSKEKQNVLNIIDHFKKFDVFPCLEDSGNKGYHLWVFFKDPISNKMARDIGKEFADSNEVFPKQDYISRDKLGNLIKLPLGIHLETSQRCLFLDNNFIPINNQVNYLENIHLHNGIELYQRIKEVNKNKKKINNAQKVKMGMKPCVKRLLANGVKRGNRNVAGLVIATECKKMGISMIEARGVLKTWNLRNIPPLPLNELSVILNSAYSNNYEYGCKEDGTLCSIVKCPGIKKCDYYIKYAEHLSKMPA